MSALATTHLLLVVLYSNIVEPPGDLYIPTANGKNLDFSVGGGGVHEVKHSMQ